MVRSYALPLSVGPNRLSRVYGINYDKLVLADNPIGYWRLGDALGSATAADSSGKGHPGAVGATVKLQQPALIVDSNDAAALFDGSSVAGAATGIVISPPPPIPRTPSVEAWFYITAPVNPANWTFGYIWGSGGDLSFPFELALSGNGLAFFINFTTQTPGWTVVPPFQWQLNTRYHVAMTWDGSWLRVFVNGAEVYANNAWAGSTMINVGSTGAVRTIGIQNGGGAVLGQPFPGRLDEVALYDYPLTPLQITAHYAAGSPGTYQQRVLFDAPLAYWRLEESYGLVLADAIGNAHPITLASAVGVTYGVPGLADGTKGLAFDGTSAYVGTCAPIPSGTTFSIECWLTPNGDSGQSYQTIWIGPAPGYIGLYKMDNAVGAGGSDRVNYFFAGNHYNNTPLLKGKRYHVVFSVNAGAGTWYLNGVPDGTVSAVPSANLQSLFCLLPVDGPDTLKVSLFDELAFYPVALSATQALAHYLAGITAQRVDVDADLPFRQLIIAADPANSGPIAIGDSGVGAGEGIVLAAPPLGSGGSGSTVYRDRILLDTPLGYWRLGEASGTVAADSSGNNHPGAYTGTVTLGAPSLVAGGDTALALSGAPLNGVSLLGIPQPALMSIELWVKRVGAQPGFARLYASGGAYEITFANGSSGQLVLYVGFTEGASDFLNTGVNVPDGTPTHVVGVWDGTAIIIYVNGVQAYRNAGFAGRTLPGVGASQPKAFGRIEGVGPAGADLIGTLDEVALYSVALSAATIAAHYQAGILSYAQRILADSPTGYWRLNEASGYAQAVLADGPTAYYRLNEASGLVAVDAAAVPHNGTIPATGVTYNAPGALADGSTALTFDGADATRINTPVATTAAIDGTTKITLELWVKPTINTALKVALGFIGDSASYIGVQNLIPYLVLSQNAPFLQHLLTGGSAPIGVWTHLVLTYDGTTQILYVNGVPVASNVWSHAFSIGAAGMNIGGYSGGSGSSFPGGVDEVAIYDHALSAQQVANHYALRTSPIATLTPVVVADSSGHAHTGTITGGVSLGVAGAIPNDAAAIFDGGAASNISLGTMPSPAVCSYEAWIKTTDAAGQFPVLGNYNGGLAGFFFGKQGTKLFVYAPLIGDVMVSVAPINTGAWVHVVATYDGTTTRMYINGVFDSARAQPNQASDTRPWWIGHAGGTPPDWLGSLDEVAFYGYCLTPAQILAHYQARALPATVGSYPSRVIQDGATNYWRLNEASGLVAVDSIGGKNGAIVGGVTLAQPGALANGDKAMGFNGSTGTINLGNVLNLTAAFSVEAWMKATGAGGGVIISKTNNGGPGWIIGTNTGKINFWGYTAAGAKVWDLLTVLGVTDNLWHHIVGTWDGTTGAASVRIYIDGVQAASVAALAGAPGNTTDPARIGAFEAAPAAPASFFGGSLDDIAIYPFALTPAQVAAHFTTGVSAPAAPGDRLVLGPFDTGPIKLSHIYAAGSGALRILGIPY